MAASRAEARRKARVIAERPPGIPLLPWSLVGLMTIPLAIAAIGAWYRDSGGVIFFGDVDWYASALPRLLADVPLYDPAKLAAHVAERPPFWNQAPGTALFSLSWPAPVVVCFGGRS